MYPRKLEKLAKDAEELEYFLAISCFNLTHILCVFFDLVETATVSPLSGVPKATQKQLLNFLDLCYKSPRSPATVLNELFVALALRLNMTWRLMRESRDCNVMQHFQEALHSVFAANAAFWKSPHAAVEDFQVELACPSYVA